MACVVSVPGAGGACPKAPAVRLPAESCEFCEALRESVVRRRCEEEQPVLEEQRDPAQSPGPVRVADVLLAAGGGETPPVPLRASGSTVVASAAHIVADLLLFTSLLSA